MYSIGEFSRISGLSIKALRLYHERELLVPTEVDATTGYRFYDAALLERARTIAELKAMTFSLDDIQSILEGAGDDADIVGYLERKSSDIARKMGNLERIAKSIDTIVQHEKEASSMLRENRFEIEEKQLPDILIGSVRWKGKYEEIGSGFKKLYRALGQHVCGKPLGLYHDAGYKEEDADIETCVPIRKGKESVGITIQKLEGGKCITLLHKGPYQDVGRSYEQLIAYAKDKGYTLSRPSREVYQKGPGMIFKGNPNNYLTEIQFLVESQS